MTMEVDDHHDGWTDGILEPRQSIKDGSWVGAIKGIQAQERVAFEPFQSDLGDPG